MASTNRGKQFISWLPDDNYVNTWPLYQGDEVYFELDNGLLIKGTIHCLKGQYIFICKRKKIKHNVIMRTQLKAVEQVELI